MASLSIIHIIFPNYTCFTLNFYIPGKQIIHMNFTLKNLAVFYVRVVTSDEDLILLGQASSSIKNYLQKK